MSFTAIHRNVSNLQLRQFALVWMLFCAAAGAWLRARHGWPTTVDYVWGLLIAWGVLGTVAPRTVRSLYLGLSYATFPIGWLVSHAALAVIYYAVVTPIGWTMRRLGRDPLRRRWEPDRASYWEPHIDETDIQRYFRQF